MKITKTTDITATVTFNKSILTDTYSIYDAKDDACQAVMAYCYWGATVSNAIFDRTDDGDMVSLEIHRHIYIA